MTLFAHYHSLQNHSLYSLSFLTRNNNFKMFNKFNKSTKLATKNLKDLPLPLTNDTKGVSMGEGIYPSIPKQQINNIYPNAPVQQGDNIYPTVPQIKHNNNEPAGSEKIKSAIPAPKIPQKSNTFRQSRADLARRVSSGIYEDFVPLAILDSSVPKTVQSLIANPKQETKSPSIHPTSESSVNLKNDSPLGNMTKETSVLLQNILKKPGDEKVEEILICSRDLDIDTPLKIDESDPTVVDYIESSQEEEIHLSDINTFQSSSFWRDKLQNLENLVLQQQSQISELHKSNHEQEVRILRLEKDIYLLKGNCILFAEKGRIKDTGANAIVPQSVATSTTPSTASIIPTGPAAPTLPNPTAPASVSPSPATAPITPPNAVTPTPPHPPVSNATPSTNTAQKGAVGKPSNAGGRTVPVVVPKHVYLTFFDKAGNIQQSIMKSIFQLYYNKEWSDDPNRLCDLEVFDGRQSQRKNEHIYMAANCKSCSLRLTFKIKAPPTNDMLHCMVDMKSKGGSYHTKQ